MIKVLYIGGELHKKTGIKKPNIGMIMEAGGCHYYRTDVELDGHVVFLDEVSFVKFRKFEAQIKEILNDNSNS